MNVLGKTETYSCTYLYQSSSNEKKFVLEKTKSHMGIFAEHIRTKKKKLKKHSSS